ncbi:MAG: TetR/AcrR family transcriptional regulator [Pseudomonadota bacterium]
MRLFWRNGYAGTGLQELLDALGITRGSFYKAFGSKKQLFLKTLDHYDSTIVTPATQLLSDESLTGEERLTRALQSGVLQLLRGEKSGCLLCNTAAEPDFCDQQISEKVTEQLDRITHAFATALKGTKRFGQAKLQVVDDEARAMTLSYVGLRILSRGGRSADTLQAAVNRQLSILKSPIEK